MKSFWRLSLLVLIPLIVGLVMVINGNHAGSLVMAVGIPAVFLLMIIIWFFLPDDKDKATDKTKNNGQMQSFQDDAEKTEYALNATELSEREKEQARLDDINDSKLYQSQINMARYEAHHISEAMKHTSPKGIALGIIFFLLLIADVVVGTVLVINGIFIGGIICAALFAVTVVTLLITAFVREKRSMNGDISKAKKIINGEVKSCFMSSMTETKSGPVVNVTSVVYGVIVSAEGVDYRASSKHFYEKGESVMIAVMSKKSAKIVSEDDIKNINLSTTPYHSWHRHRFTTEHRSARHRNRRR